MIEFGIHFHGNLFPRVQLTISQHWSGYGLEPNRRQAIILTNADRVHGRIYVALQADELKRMLYRVYCYSTVELAYMITRTPSWTIASYRFL